jgi:hypothetical protein
MNTKNVAVLSLWRDSSSYLKHSLAQFEAMEESLLNKGVNCVYAFLKMILRTRPLNSFNPGSQNAWALLFQKVLVPPSGEV